MLTSKDFFVQEQMRKELMAQAAHARLVKSVSSQKGSSLKKVSFQVLGLVGSRLVRLGENLLSRCADMTLVRSGQSSQSNS